MTPTIYFYIFSAVNIAIFNFSLYAVFKTKGGVNKIVNGIMSFIMFFVMLLFTYMIKISFIESSNPYYGGTSLNNIFVLYGFLFAMCFSCISYFIFMTMEKTYIATIATIVLMSTAMFYQLKNTEAVYSQETIETEEQKTSTQVETRKGKDVAQHT